MKKYALLRLLLATVALSWAGPISAQSWNWATLGRRGTTQTWATTTAVAADPATGNTWVGGVFRDTLQCGATQLVSAGRADFFVGELDPAGQWLWAVRGGSAANDSLASLAYSAAAGHVVAVGTLGHGGALGTAPAGPVGAPESMFVAMFGPTGSVDWVRLASPPAASGGIPSRGSGVAVDGAGHIYVSGTFPTRPTQVAVAASLTLSNPAGVQNFVARVNSIGVFEWATSVQPTTTEEYWPTHLAATAAGSVFVGGHTTSEPAGGNGWAAKPFVRALQATTGAPRWHRADSLLLPGALFCNGLATDRAGRVFVAGTGENLRLTALDATTGLTAWQQAGQPGPFTGAASGGLACTATGDVTWVGDFQRLPCICDGSMGGGDPQITEWWGTVRFDNDTAVVRGGQGYVVRLAGATGRVRWALEAPAGFGSVADDGLGRTRVGGITYEATPANGRFGAVPFTLPAASGPFTALVAELNASGPLPRVLSVGTAPVGATVTLSGYNLGGTTQVLVGGVAVVFTVVNGTTITFVVPPGVSGVVQVTTPLGTATGPYFETAAPLATAALPSVPAALLLWPNPARDGVRLTLGDGAPTDVELCDALGRVLARLTAQRGVVTLPLVGLPAGTYVVRAGARVARLLVDRAAE